MIAPPHELGATVALPALGLAGTVIGRAVGAAGHARYVVRLGAGCSVKVDGADLAGGRVLILERPPARGGALVVTLALDAQQGAG